MNKLIIILISFGFLVSSKQQKEVKKSQQMEYTQNLKDLAERKGSRPQTGDALPHLQITDNSSVHLYNDLAMWLFSLKYVEERPTIISVRGARAAWIKDDYPNVNSDALPNGREFTHIHPLDIYGGGSQHLSLKRSDCEIVIEKGWGEYHPLNAKIFPDNKYGLVMTYAPRTTEELKAIKVITLKSYHLVINKNQ